jgi:phosphoserine phosphatase RsbU/P
MTDELNPGWLSAVLRRQTIVLMISAAVIGILWAITGSAPSLVVTLLYSFLLGNGTALVLEKGVPCTLLRNRWGWLVYAAVLVVVTPILVALSTAILFAYVPPELVPPAPRDSFWLFLWKAWRFPAIANLVFGAGYTIYLLTRVRLETRNRQLQQTIESEIASRKLDLQELQQAREIQEGLLPKEIPQVYGFEIATAWEPAKIVGGDYYDVIRLNRDKLAICIADVSGKGISAALLMANVQAAVRAFSSENVRPSEVCARINSVLCTNIAPGKFVTLFYGVLDAHRRTLAYCNAGHPRPLLVHQSGTATRLEESGALLGVLPDWEYEDSLLQLGPGGTLLLFTDGITEAMAEDGEEFGEERLIAAAANHELPLQERQERLLEQVKDFCHSRMNDDATLIMISAAHDGPEEKNQARISTNQLIYSGVQR